MPSNLCGSHQVSVLANRSRCGANLRSVICIDCGLVWSDPFPYDPRKFYENDYRLEYKKTCAPKPKHILRAGKVALTRYHKIRHLLTRRQTLLDVGTGGGEFAFLLQSLGHELFGIEPNRGYAEYSIAEYALNLQVGFIQDSQFNASSFDVITIWHVLEHTADPGQVLAKLQSLLKPQGYLIVEVPNIEAVCQSPKSTFHSAHLFNFNLPTLTRLGEKAGLKVESHLFSKDGGNITLFFRKAAPVVSSPENWSIPGNAERISTRINSHCNLNHYLTLAPYERFFLRMLRAVSERIRVRAYESNKDLLEHLYQKVLATDKV